MSFGIYLVLLLLPVASCTTTPNFYLNYQIWRMDWNKETADVVLKLQAEDLVDMLTDTPREKATVMVAPDNVMEVTKSLRRFKPEVITSNVRNLLEGNRRASRNAGDSATEPFDFLKYHDITTIYNRLHEIANNHSEVVEVHVLGKTHEGREIKYVRISHNISDNSTRTKPVLWIDGGIHAREWVSPSTVMYIIETLLGYRELQHLDKAIEFLEKYQFYITPVLNPDGYQYTRNRERLWRKNRIPGCYKNVEALFGNCFYKLCYGVDLNRNWPDGFGGPSTSSNLCSLVYPGEQAFDQLETKAVKEKIEALQKETSIDLFLTFHSYSQLFLIPYGYTGDKVPAEHEYHKAQGDRYVNAVFARHGKRYINQRSSELYPAGGISADWAFISRGILDSYTVELRPNDGELGFLLPDTEIIATGQENVDGVMALIENLKINVTQNGS